MARTVTPQVASSAQAFADNRVARKRLYSNDNWSVRRKVIFASLMFFAALIAYLVFMAPDDELRRTMALPIVGAFVSIVLGYAGFAVMDDNNKRTTMAATDAAVDGEE